MSKTIHGCTCKEEWSFAPGGKKYKGCVMGGPDNALCPLTKDSNKLKKSCIGSSQSRPYCAVKEKNCGWIKKNDSGLQEGQGIDWCDWSTFSFGEERNTPPMILNPRRYYIGLGIFIIIYTFIIPWILYATNKLFLLNSLLPNFHLFATVLSFPSTHTGSYDTSKFSFLIVNEAAPNTVALISSKILDLCSLLGLVYIVIINSIKKNIAYGLVFGAIILTMTHLVGVNIIKKTNNYLYYKILTKKQTGWGKRKRSFISAIGGMGIALIMIFVEGVLLKQLNDNYN